MAISVVIAIASASFLFEGEDSFDSMITVVPSLLFMAVGFIVMMYGVS